MRREVGGADAGSERAWLSGTAGHVSVPPRTHPTPQVLLETRPSASGRRSRPLTTGGMDALDEGEGAEDDAASTADSAGGDGGEDVDTVVPLFRLIPGRAASSYGLDCARKGGVPREVCERARVVSQCLARSGHVEPLAPLAANEAARRTRELAQLEMVRGLLAVEDWASATAQELVDALSMVLSAHAAGAF